MGDRWSVRPGGVELTESEAGRRSRLFGKPVSLHSLAHLACTETRFSIALLRPFRTLASRHPKILILNHCKFPLKAFLVQVTGVQRCFGASHPQILLTSSMEPSTAVAPNMW